MLKRTHAHTPRWYLFFLLFFCFAAAILGDSTAEALLLSHFNASIIPKMFLVNAFFLFLVSSLMISVVDRVDRGLFFQFLIILHCLVLTATHFVLNWNLEIIYPLLFSYAYCSKIVFFLLFWTIANDLVDSRKASSEFPLIAAGGTLGAILCSFAIPWIIKLIPAVDLVAIWALLLAVVILLLFPFRAQFGKYFTQNTFQNKKNQSIRRILSDMTIVKTEPLLWNISIIYFLLFFLLINQQFTFYYEIKGMFSTADKVASFLGFFNGISMLSTLVLQMSVSGYFLKKFGSTRSMLMIPFVLFTVFVSLVLIRIFDIPNIYFWTVVAGMSIRVAFFDAFFSPNFQIFFSSLPKEIRGRGKLSIEGVVKPSAIIVASLWIVVSSSFIPATLNLIHLLIISFVLIVFVFKLKSQYADSLSRFLNGISNRQALALLDSELLKKDKKYVSYIRDLLRKENFEIQKFIIEALANSKLPEAIAILIESLENADSKLKATIITNFKCINSERVKETVIKYLNDSDSRVVANAIEVLTQFKDRALIQKIEPFLSHQNNRVRANTILAIWGFTPDEKKQMLFDILDSMIQSEQVLTIASALYVLGEMDSDKAEELLLAYHTKNEELITVGNRMVFRQMVLALSKKGNERSLKLLLVIGSHVNRMRKEEIVKGICGMIPAFSWNTFEKIVSRNSPVDRYLVLSALHYSDKRSLSDEISSHIRHIAFQEIDILKATLFSLRELKDVNVGENLLYHAIMEEYVELRFETLLIIASLFDPSNRIRGVMPKLNHPNSHVRARAIEVLDTIGDTKINKAIIKMMELKEKINDHTATKTAERKSAYPVIEGWLNDENEWVSECARFSEYCIKEDWK